MGLLDIFGKKKQGVPVIDQVIDMRQRGMPDQMIAQNLQAQGVPPAEIQDGMMQADIKMRVGGPPSPSVSAPPQFLPQASMPPQGPEYQGAQMAGMMAQPMPQMWPPMAQPQPFGPPPQMWPPPSPSGQMPPYGPPAGPEMAPLPPTGSPYQPPMGQFGVSTEDLVEKIVSEKFERVEKRLSEQEKIHGDLIQQIQQLRDSLSDTKARYAQLQEDSVVKIEEYNKELESVGAQIKALQRVFQNIIPTFAENVRSLNEVVKELRGREKEEEETRTKPEPWPRVRKISPQTKEEDEEDFEFKTR